MRHYFEKLKYNIIHADEFKEEYLRKDRINLVENVRWRKDKPNRKGRYLNEVFEIIKNYPDVGIAYDLAHAYINEEAMEEILKYKDKIKMFHIQDTVGKKDLHLPVMSGEINYIKFFDILKTINFKGILWIE